MNELLKDIARKNIIKYPYLTQNIDKIYDKAILQIKGGKGLEYAYKMFLSKLNKLIKRGMR